MVKPEELPDTAFVDSRLYKKLSKVLFTPYVRIGDHIEFHDDIVFDKEHPLFEQIWDDYHDIQTFYMKNGCLPRVESVNIYRSALKVLVAMLQKHTLFT